MISIQTLSTDPGGSPGPKEIIGTMFTLNFEEIGKYSMMSLANITAQDRVDLSQFPEPDDGHLRLWEKLCKAIIIHEAAACHTFDSRGIDAVYEKLLLSLAKEDEFNWMAHKFSVDVALLLHRYWSY